ncbi:hypothetical protein RvY_10928-2 [Ramazzottius varieornatus]|uniref:guanylate cyclase n=1 Tax=Ramazzottius varieornatus TaxID=947166 RepID=A0A1D1VEF1_RAMVA|nr:hypothetical protein RvY_10928-2 [Ramazzottius varieornatus]
MDMTNSEYVYFTVEPYRDVEFFGRLQASFNDSSDEVARKAFRYLFQITGTCTKSVSVGMRRLQDQIKRRSAVEYGVKYRHNEDPSESVLASYFSVKTLGIVVDEALKAGADVYNGAAMARRFFNHTWYLNERTINIDPMGNRIMDLCMRAFDNDSDTFRNVMYYDPTLTTLSELERIKWYTENGTQPPNEPRCGFKGDNPACAEPGPGIALVAGTAVPAVVLLLVVSLCGFWRFRREVELKDNWWLGNKADLMSPDSASNRRYSISRHTSPSYSLSTMGKDPKHFRTYRGNPVWIFKVQTLQTFFLNRSKRTILREMKLISHVNLVHLQGLLIEKETLTFMYEFCQKGSLAGLLERMTLDWEFRAGLIHDLLEGVVVIHQSLIRRHGYLSPFTCLIDQRFTLKLAEFGLYDLIKDVTTPEMSNKLSENSTITYANTEQWIAPELQAKFKTNGMKNVRNLAAIAGPEADVYAAGGLIDMVMEENLALDDAAAPPRYSLSGIRTIVEACQHYEPWRRPMADEVKRRFVLRTGARSGGFLESLVRRMEMYARRMEFAVRERTEALKAERKVCEKLLEEMLPKSIVERLRSGYAVEPEHFSRVTIFFSVIVGFVEFVSVTSPMEVIDFLNSIFSSFDAALSTYDVYKVEVLYSLF